MCFWLAQYEAWCWRIIFYYALRYPTKRMSDSEMARRVLGLAILTFCLKNLLFYW